MNLNPTNYFAEVEQAAFNPSNLVPGIGISPDKMLQARLLSYQDTHIHRLGINYHRISVNVPKYSPENNYQRDGLMRVDANGSSGHNYWPSSFGGPVPYPAFLEPTFEVLGLAARTPYRYPNDNFVQPSNLYRDFMTYHDRENLIGNIVSHLSAAQKRIQLRDSPILQS